jgi:hypothetical protein
MRVAAFIVGLVAIFAAGYFTVMLRKFGQMEEELGASFTPPARLLMEHRHGILGLLGGSGVLSIFASFLDSKTKIICLSSITTLFTVATVVTIPVVLLSGVGKVIQDLAP